MSAKNGTSGSKILHYHLFKNAGTSVDAILMANYPNAWRSREFHGVPTAEISSEVERWISAERDARAFSSHTAVGPLPLIEGVNVVSLLFLRHPIDRIRSAYFFEQKQNAQTLGSTVARQSSFPDYVSRLLDTPNERSLRNFQTQRLSQFSLDRTGSEYDRAVEGLGVVSFVGLVERFAQSMAMFQKAIRSYFPDFFILVAKENTGELFEQSLDERLELVRDMLGNSVHDRLVEANSDDIHLYAEACKRFDDL